MKNLFVYVFLFLNFCVYSQENQFKIIKVKGGITNKITNLLVKQGDEIAPQNPIQFITKEAEAFALIKGKGVYTISKNSSDVFSTANAYLIQDVAVLMTDNVQLNIRNVSNEFSFSSNNFNNSTLFVIGDSTMLNFSVNQYPLNDNNSISFELSVDENDLIIIPEHVNQSICITKNILKASLNDTIKNVNIMYYNSMQNSINKEATINIVFLNYYELKNEFIEIKNGFNGIENDKIYRILQNYFFSVYGLTNGKDLHEFIMQILE